MEQTSYDKLVDAISHMTAKNYALVGVGCCGDAGYGTRYYFGRVERSLGASKQILHHSPSTIDYIDSEFICTTYE